MNSWESWAVGSILGMLRAPAASLWGDLHPPGSGKAPRRRSAKPHPEDVIFPGAACPQLIRERGDEDGTSKASFSARGN